MFLYSLPRLIDINAKSSILRQASKILIASRCLETEKPQILEEYKRKGYVILTACPEAEHVNMLGFKLAGILVRGSYEETSVLTVDGSMHCTQLHWMVEEVFKITRATCSRRHFVVHKGEVVEISQDAVKKSRFLSWVAKHQ
jgi:hypothetical protein